VAGREVIPKRQKANQYALFDDKLLYWQAWDFGVYDIDSRTELALDETEISGTLDYRGSVITAQATPRRPRSKQSSDSAPRREDMASVINLCQVVHKVGLSGVLLYNVCDNDCSSVKPRAELSIHTMLDTLCTHAREALFVSHDRHENHPGSLFLSLFSFSFLLFFFQIRLPRAPTRYFMTSKTSNLAESIAICTARVIDCLGSSSIAIGEAQGVSAVLLCSRCAVRCVKARSSIFPDLNILPRPLVSFLNTSSSSQGKGRMSGSWEGRRAVSGRVEQVEERETKGHLGKVQGIISSCGQNSCNGCPHSSLKVLNMLPA
jgi:hypothetical protein